MFIIYSKFPELRINIKQLKIAMYQILLGNVYNFPWLHVVITLDINVAYLSEIEASTTMARKPSDVYCAP